MAITDGRAIIASDVISEDVPPTLLEFALDIDLGVLDLTFDDVIDVMSFVITGFTLYRNADGNGDRFTFVTSTVMRVSPGTVITVDISEADLNGIKSTLRPTMDITTLYLSVAANSVTDSFGNVMPPISLLPSTTLVPDTFLPTLTRFSLDLNRALLQLTFTEAVEIESLEPSGITLQNLPSRLLPNFVAVPFTSAVNPSIIGTVVNFGITNDDFGRITSRPTLATAINNTYLSLTRFAFTDSSGNPVVPIRDIDGLEASEFIPDVTGPALMSFELSLADGTLTLRFTEAINVSSIQLSEAQLQSTRDVASNATVLQFIGDISLLDTQTVEIALTQQNLNFLKNSDNIATDSSNVYLVFNESFVVDYYENQIVPAPTSLAFPVTVFQPDNTSSVFLDFTLDLEMGIISVVFDEGVNDSTINIESFALQNSAVVSSPIDYFTLTNSSTFTLTNSSVLEIILSNADLNGVKGVNGVGFINTSFIRGFDGALRDQFGNPFAEQSFPAQTVIQDTNRPDLTGFTFDLDSGQLLLTFNETVDAASFDPSQVTLSSGSSPPIVMYTLTAETTAMAFNTPVLTILLSPFDETQLRAMPTLAVDESSTNLQLTAAALTDPAGNPVIPISGQMADGVFLDMSLPEVTSITLDLNTYSLTLSFSKVINITTFDPQLLTLQSSRNGSGSALTLSGGSYDTSMNARVLTIKLTPEDILLLQADSVLGASVNTTYLSIAGGRIFDLNNFNVSDRKSVV